MIFEKRRTTIFCDLDGPDCTGAFKMSGWGSFVENRKEARKLGWQLGRDFQYCPNCKAAARQPVDTDQREIRGL